MNDIQLVVTNINGDDVWLDLYKEEPIRLTFNIEDVLNLTPKAEFTRQFRVPGTDTNYDFFTTLFEINGTDFNPGVKYPARLMLGGALFREGEIRIVNVYRNDVLNRYDYEVAFIGPAKALASEVEGKTIGDLDWSAYETAGGHDLGDVEASWEAYPENASLTAGLFDGDVIYPLVDFGNTYTANITLQPRIAVGHPSADGGSFDQSNHPISFRRLKPMVRMRTILLKIFEEAGYEIESNWLDSTEQYQMYLSAWGNDTDLEVDTSNANLAKISRNTTQAVNSNQFSTTYVNLPVTNWDYGNNIEPSFIQPTWIIYNTPENGTYKVRYRIPLEFSITELEQMNFTWQTTQFGPPGQNVTYRFECSGPVDEEPPSADDPGEVKVYRNNILQETLAPDVWEVGEEFGEFGFGRYTYQIDEEITTALTNFNDYDVNPGFFQVLLNTDNSQPDTYINMLGGAFMNVVEAPGGFNLGQQFDPDYLQLDFVKDIFTLFRLVLVPDPYNPNKFRIEPWSQYIGTNQAEVKDWTEKLDLSKDLVIRPLLLDQTDRLTLTMAEGRDHLNVENQEIYNEVFGTKKIDSVYEILKDEKVLSTKIAATPATQIEGADGDWINIVIPQEHLQEPNEAGGTTHKPIRPKPRLLYYNGLEAVTGGSSYWIYDIAGPTSKVEYFSVPIVSYYSQWLPQPNVKILNFELEDSYEIGGVVNNLYGQDLYTRYWSKYIELIYNKDSRRLTGYFILDDEDILNFEYDDVIFVRGNYYYVEKINEAPLGGRHSVKVDLIKLLDYTPPVAISGRTVTLWENASVDFDQAASNWENA